MRRSCEVTCPSLSPSFSDPFNDCGKNLGRMRDKIGIQDMPHLCIQGDKVRFVRKDQTVCEIGWVTLHLQIEATVGSRPF